MVGAPLYKWTNRVYRTKCKNHERNWLELNVTYNNERTSIGENKLYARRLENIANCIGWHFDTIELLNVNRHLYQLRSVGD